MRPISQWIPKELVPLGSVPALYYVLKEALTAGVERIGVVISPGKPMIAEYLESLAHDLLLGVEVALIEQPTPNGLGDALLCARDFVAGEPFALLLPDNFLPGAEHRFADLVALHDATGKDVIGVLELSHADSGRYGNCGRIDYSALADDGLPEPCHQRALIIERLADKEPGTIEIGPGESLRRTCGRYVCRPHLLDWLVRVRAEVEGELSEVAGYQALVLRDEVCGLVLAGPLFDIGIPSGYLAASAWLNEQSNDEPGPA